jgi:hypothetical protein
MLLVERRKPTMAKTVQVARSATTGKFVKPSYAAQHPRTTVVERIKKSK